MGGAHNASFKVSFHLLGLSFIFFFISSIIILLVISACPIARVYSKASSATFYVIFLSKGHYLISCEHSTLVRGNGLWDPKSEDDLALDEPNHRTEAWLTFPRGIVWGYKKFVG